jgi:hypothetical protein
MDEKTIDLAARIAKCGCGKTRQSNDKYLNFFEYQGPGSDSAELSCGQCGMHRVVHQPINPSTGREGVTDHEFTPRGDVGYDRFYCGCYGWD